MEVLKEKLGSGLETHFDRSKISILAFPRRLFVMLEGFLKTSRGPFKAEKKNL